MKGTWYYSVPNQRILKGFFQILFAANPALLLAPPPSGRQ